MIHMIYVDGGVSNNGSDKQNAIVCLIYENESFKNKIIMTKDIGNHTNNEAELIAIENAFDWVNKNIKEEKTLIYSDSLLAVNMINYVWKGKIERLKTLRDKIAKKKPKNVIVSWISRENNKAGKYLEI